MKYTVYAVGKFFTVCEDGKPLDRLRGIKLTERDAKVIAQKLNEVEDIINRATGPVWIWGGD